MRLTTTHFGEHLPLKTSHLAEELPLRPHSVVCLLASEKRIPSLVLLHPCTLLFPSQAIFAVWVPYYPPFGASLVRVYLAAVLLGQIVR